MGIPSPLQLSHRSPDTGDYHRDMPPMGIGRSLWLIPDDPAYTALAAKIAELSVRFDAPRFEPHVTVLAGLEQPAADIVAACKRVASELGPIRIRLGQAGHHDEYFRCLFLEAEDAGGLRSAHAAVRRALAPAASAAFFPHLSLLYAARGGEDADALVRETASAGLGFDLEVKALDLVSTEGPVEAWHRVERIALV
jgi:2'-5' RNA ligase